MGIDTESRHITSAGGNAFSELGFEQEEATELKDKSQRIIAEKMVSKDFLMTEQDDAIRSPRGQRLF